MERDAHFTAKWGHAEPAPLTGGAGGSGSACDSDSSCLGGVSVWHVLLCQLVVLSIILALVHPSFVTKAAADRYGTRRLCWVKVGTCALLVVCGSYFLPQVVRDCSSGR